MDGQLPARGRFASLEDDIARARSLKRLRQFHQRVLSLYLNHSSHDLPKDTLIHDLSRILSDFKA